jgi:mannose-6-phosphate isomerase-like protein (cupin superfamily)
MTEPTFQQFEANARAQGYDQVVELNRPADTLLDTHSHPFAVSARIIEGSFSLTVGDHTRHLQAGDTFELDADVPHVERYGAQGARSWAARRTLPAASTA